MNMEKGFDAHLPDQLMSWVQPIFSDLSDDLLMNNHLPERVKGISMSDMPTSSSGFPRPSCRYQTVTNNDQSIKTGKMNNGDRYDLMNSTAMDEQFSPYYNWQQRPHQYMKIAEDYQPWSAEKPLDPMSQFHQDFNSQDENSAFVVEKSSEQNFTSRNRLCSSSSSSSSSFLDFSLPSSVQQDHTESSSFLDSRWSGRTLSSYNEATAEPRRMPSSLSEPPPELTNLISALNEWKLYQERSEASVHSQPRPVCMLEDKGCVLCKKNGKSKAFYSTHVLKDNRGVVICPVLRKFSCPKCGATGDDAHTLRHCPIARQENHI